MIEPITLESADQLATRFRRGDRGDRKIRAAPFEVRIETVGRGRFEDVRDAIAAARISKKDHPLSRVCVADLTTGQILVEIEL
jgi:hypothetical protein